MSRLGWNEIQNNAQVFANEWRDAKYERSETQSFYNAFFNIFGIDRRKVATFERSVKKPSGQQGFIDVFWHGLLLIEQKSAGGDLQKARSQAQSYLPGLPDEELPRYLLCCDFQTFELYDLVEDEHTSFKLCDLRDHVHKFSFILGIQKRTFKDQDPVNIKASILMGRLHDELYASGYKGHDLERLLVRLLFCLFADDTGIFGKRDIFHDLLSFRTSTNGKDLGLKLELLFQVLNTEEGNRDSTLDEDLAGFPYINGDLFKERLRLSNFNPKMRELLLESCEFNWDAISPAIFGALFQHVSGDAAARRAHGEHYTTENHIMRLIGPLFLDDLKAELESIKLKKRAADKDRGLLEFCKKLSDMTFFDPACGCGNFLVIAYREIRQLEVDAITEYYRERDRILDNIDEYSGVDVHQFFGIEVHEFPARIAEVAMWMMDHIMNNRLSVALTKNFARIPLKKSPSIVQADALEIEWASVLEPAKCTFVFGNPPFLGAKVQDGKQRAQVQELAKLGKSKGTLDYVAAWYFKAAEYIKGSPTQVAFVSTNSITQGEQAGQLWPALIDGFGLEISFAHRTFAWSSDAKGPAQVHVVIVGLVAREFERRTKRLFSYPDIKGLPVESAHNKLSPYLFDADKLSNPHLVVREVATPINRAKKLVSGVQPIDNGHYLLDPAEYEAMLDQYPRASGFLRPYLGATEFLYNNRRWIIMPQSLSPDSLRRMPLVKERVRLVREFRLRSKRPATVALADTPTMFQINTVPSGPFLVLPQTSSEDRRYMPIGFYDDGWVPNNGVRVISKATRFDFGILTSTMHMAWMRAITGRLNSRYQYSIGVVYNNFPWPVASVKQVSKVEELAQGVLDARAVHSTSSLADLYDSVAMPANLRKAHQALDAAVDKLYRPSGFSSDAERVEHLFGLYERMTSLFSEDTPARKPRRKKAE